MLYDHKRWDKPQTVYDTRPLRCFIEWLEMQPPEQAYDFNNCRGGCLMGQYMAWVGQGWSMLTYEAHAMRMDPRATPGYFPIGGAMPHTFGAALKRAHATLVELS